MRVEYINPFVKSLSNTFDTMLGCQITRGKLQLKTESNPLHEISGIIGLSGKAVGTVIVSLSKNVALQAASAMLLTEATELDNDVIDAVGEITNIVAGSAKVDLQQYELSISLPNVVTGTPHGIRFPSNVQPICVPFESAWGPLMLEVGLEEVPAAVGVEV